MEIPLKPDEWRFVPIGGTDERGAMRVVIRVSLAAPDDTRRVDITEWARALPQVEEGLGLVRETIWRFLRATKPALRPEDV